MAEGIADRIRRYVLDGTDADLQRLLSIAELQAPPVRSALQRVGVQPGWRALECGCGPLGSLAVLAECVGPVGRVVGVDFNEAAVGRARSCVTALGLDCVDVVCGDVDDMDVDALGGPFDIAVTRCFLMHQRDSESTLRRIAQVLRPGGWLVVQEPMDDPAPRAHPPAQALDEYWTLLHDVLARSGVPRKAVAGLKSAAREAGLEVVEAGGFFLLMDPVRGFDLHASTAAALRERAMAAGCATADDLHRLDLCLRGAAHQGHEWVTTPFFIELVLRKPEREGGMAEGTADRGRHGAVERGRLPS